MAKQFCWTKSSHRNALLLVSSILLLFANSHAATLLETGSGAELVTVERRVLLPKVERPLIYFDLGFATEEQLFPQSFYDSLSVSLRNADGGTYSFLLTADISGVTWAPTTPGGFQLNQDGIVRERIDFPVSGIDLPNQFAYRVGFAVPDPFMGESLDVIFDLFDNQNAFRSVGYVSDLTVIPEPRTWVIFVFGLAALGIVYRKRKES